MCGYLRREYGTVNFGQSLKSSGLGEIYAELDNRQPGISSFLPAYANTVHHKIPDVVIEDENGKRKLVNPTWWYDCRLSNNVLHTAGKQSFNARNLELPLWKEPIRYRRGIAVMTGLGESIYTKPDNKGKHQYLMLADKPVLFGVLYQQFDDDICSAAVITRHKQLGFDKYHSKAFPFFINPDKYFVDLWLSKNVTEEEPAIAESLAHPTWYERLAIDRVKTFSGGQLFKNSQTEFLQARPI